jgi:uncharacterized protein
MLDLRSFELQPGSVRRETATVHLDPIILAGQAYDIRPQDLPVELELQPGHGSLFMKLRFEAAVRGPCMRCLEDAELHIRATAEEYQDEAAAARGEEELTSDYLDDMRLDIEAWARDTIADAIPEKILCSADCAGLCALCGQRLEPGEDHACAEPEADSRWEKLKELL